MIGHYCSCRNTYLYSADKTVARYCTMAPESIIRIHPEPHKLHKPFPFSCKYFSLAMTHPANKKHGFSWLIRSHLFNIGYLLSGLQDSKRILETAMHGPELQPCGVLGPAEAATLGALFIKNIKVNHIQPPFN